VAGLLLTTQHRRESSKVQFVAGDITDMTSPKTPIDTDEVALTTDLGALQTSLSPARRHDGYTLGVSVDSDSSRVPCLPPRE
jgi:hypothetical protein